MKEPITAFYICVLSALRLCVWLCDNRNIEFFYMNKRFFPAFGAEQGEVYQLRIGTHFDTGLTAAHRA
jgi:hypothetical protein